MYPIYYINLSMINQIYFLKDDLCTGASTTYDKLNVSPNSVLHYLFKKKKNISHIEERTKIFQNSI